MRAQKLVTHRVRWVASMLSLLVATSGGMLATQAEAEQLQAIPSAWRLQDYQDGTLTLYFTGSTCPSGELILLASSSEASKDRFWALIMTGKAGRVPIGVYYSVVNDACRIDSFYMAESAE